MSGWKYLTLERTKMDTWTRKHRMKFRKRWRKHHGRPFRWAQSEFVCAVKPEYPEYAVCCFLVKEDKVGLGASLK